MNNNPSGDYYLTNNIDCTSIENFEPIASFSGYFNGMGFTISNLKISRSSQDNIGLFGSTNNAVIINVVLSNINIKGQANVGGLAGYMNKSYVNGVKISGLVESSSSCVGGLSGRTDNTGIYSCSFIGHSKGLSVDTGGIVGYFLTNSSLSNSYASGVVEGTGLVGGLVGRMEMNTSITNSYADSSVTGSDLHVGGLVGWQASSSVINRSYAAGAVSGPEGYVGGLVGWDYDNTLTVTSSYWDMQTSGQATTAGNKGTGLTTTQMKTQSSFVDWNFVDVWKAPETNYAKLSWEETVPISTCEGLQNISNNLGGSYYLVNDIDCSDTVNWNSGKGFRPIGLSDFWNISSFRGTFDGKGYKITNLYINRTDASCDLGYGLFGYAIQAIIQNVGIEQANIKGRWITGALIGLATSNVFVTNCYSSGDISALKQGGLACGHDGLSRAGGLIGQLWSSNSRIYNVYSNAKVSGTGEEIGGLVGVFYGYANSTSYIKNSYSTGLVACSTNYCGGFLGHLYENAYIINSYWDMQTSGKASSAAGVGKSTSDMKSKSTFSGWDFTNVWYLIYGDYPRLKTPYPVCTGCAVLEDGVCVAGGSCSGEHPTCNVTGWVGLCECSSSTCGDGRACSDGVCVNCDSDSACGACGCGTSQKPTGTGACMNNSMCCPGECNMATGANSCGYSDDLCPTGVSCNRSTLSCCANELPYWRSENCRSCSSTSGLSGNCQTPGMMCNSRYDCIVCLANSQCTCEDGEVADGMGGCVEPYCYSDSECGVDECVNAGLYNAFCSNCSSVNKVWHSTSCESCPAGSVYSNGVCVCSDGKMWNSANNLCLSRGVISSGGILDLKTSNTINASDERYARIKRKMNRITSSAYAGAAQKKIEEEEESQE
ncbi:MAG: ZmpA/ZmpB/ZmpC family metallo-endopeptidase-related protein [Alphaproteobacteria bacterium]